MFAGKIKEFPLRHVRATFTPRLFANLYTSPSRERDELCFDGGCGGEKRVFPEVHHARSTLLYKAVNSEGASISWVTILSKAPSYNHSIYTQLYAEV